MTAPLKAYLNDYKYAITYVRQLPRESLCCFVLSLFLFRRGEWDSSTCSRLHNPWV